MSFLEYQDEMYTDVVTDDACLIITSRGLGLEQLMVRLLRTYSDDTNLVIVIGTDPDDEMFFMNQLYDQKHIPIGKMPQRLTSESSNTKKRREIYLAGGVLFVTERILVVDLLADRVPIDLVTGIIVYKAHKVYNDCLMSFILRLYRQRNKKGFIKALSQSPHAFFGDYGKLDKIMRSLFATSLLLWPRFHASVQASLGKPRVPPEVNEFYLPMSETMKQMQFDIMDLIDMCLKELAKTNTTFLYDSDQLNVENAINKSFDGFLKRRFDEIWHQLGSRAKRLIQDVKFLRHLLHLLTQADIVTFYNQTRAAQNSVRMGNDVSDWIFWKPADRLFKLSKERLYPNSSPIEDFESETNPKWKAFQDLIKEIEIETKDTKQTVDVFIITSTDSVARQLSKILTIGATKLLEGRVKQFSAILAANSTISTDAIDHLGLQFDVEKQQQQLEDKEKSSSDEPPAKKPMRKFRGVVAPEQADTFTLTQLVRRMTRPDDQPVVIDVDDVASKEPEIIDFEKQETTDSSNTTTSTTTTGFTTKSDKSPPLANVKPKRYDLKLHYFCSRSKNIVFEQELYEHLPMYFIMYDLDPQIIRQIEIYQALKCTPMRCKVYTMHFERSWEMQQYYTSLRREKEAFENLIREKSTMVIPMGRNGKIDGHPDLMRGCMLANETTDSLNSRRAGGQLDRNEIIKQKILVDMREFRCELPAIIHKRGIEIEPIQLEIGDYILSSDTCVERKTVSDLIQSLQSGRLFNQAAMMTRHFARAILLIEFDESKSFHFKGRYWGMQGTGRPTTSGGAKKDYSQDLIDRLILLTIHHPQLRIVWSPSTHFTSELFEYLKEDRDQPDPAKISAISSQELPPETFEDRYDLEIRDFLLKLPGVNTRNVYSIMNAVPTLRDIVLLEREQLEELLGSSRSAQLFYDTLHLSLAKMASDAISREKESKRTGLFECSKRKKGLLS